MCGHGQMRWVILPRREGSGVLHGAVAARRDPRGGAVNQSAPLGQEVRRSAEIPALHNLCVALYNPKYPGGVDHSDQTKAIYL